MKNTGDMSVMNASARRGLPTPGTRVLPRVARDHGSDLQVTQQSWHKSRVQFSAGWRPVVDSPFPPTNQIVLSHRITRSAKTSKQLYQNFITEWIMK